jgi:H2-forming N5,N10-methylenetetrahydromethanopterin dehydrogenase-like enzyme
MPIPIIEISENVEKIYSPFSGIVIDPEEGIDESDPTILFTNYANAACYISRRLIDHLGDVDENSIITEEIASKITLPGAVVFLHNCGWNGVMHYGFAPVSQ